MFNFRQLTLGAAHLQMLWKTWNAGYESRDFSRHWDMLKAKVATKDLSAAELISLTVKCLPLLARQNVGLVPTVAKDLLLIAHRQTPDVQTYARQALIDLIPVMAKISHVDIPSVLYCLIKAVPADQPHLAEPIFTAGVNAIDSVVHHSSGECAAQLVATLADIATRKTIDPNPLINTSLRAMYALDGREENHAAGIIATADKLSQQTPGGLDTLTKTGAAIIGDMTAVNPTAAQTLIQTLAARSQDRPDIATTICTKAISAAKTLLQRGLAETATDILSTARNIASPDQKTEIIALALGPFSEVKPKRTCSGALSALEMLKPYCTEDIPLQCQIIHRLMTQAPLIAAYGIDHTRDAIVFARELAELSPQARDIFENEGQKCLTETFEQQTAAGQILLNHLLRLAENQPEKAAALIDDSLALAQKHSGTEMPAAILETLALTRCLGYSPKNLWDHITQEHALPESYNGFTSREIMVSPSFHAPFNHRSYIILGTDEQSSRLIVPWGTVALSQSEDVVPGNTAEGYKTTDAIIRAFAESGRAALQHRESLPSLKASAAKPSVA